MDCGVLFKSYQLVQGIFNYSTGTTPNIMKIKGVGTETLKSYKVVAGSGINHSGLTTFVFLSLNLNFFFIH